MAGGFPNEALKLIDEVVDSFYPDDYCQVRVLYVVAKLLVRHRMGSRNPSSR